MVAEAPLHFEILGPEGTERRALASREAIWIGRDEDCDITLFARNISRRHLSIERAPGGFRITDASANGTLLNELPLKRASRTVRGAGFLIELGPFRIGVGSAPSGHAETFEKSDTAHSESLSGVSPPAGEAPASGQASVTLRRRIHRLLLDHLDLVKLRREALAEASMRPRVVNALRRILADLGDEIDVGVDREELVLELTDEALGLGPLQGLLNDPDVSEIMVVDPHTIFAERRGRMSHTGLRFTDDDAVRAAIERIVTPLGRRIDESTPLVDARLKDGSRVNAVIPPLAIKGPCITIRKFAKDPLAFDDLIRFGSIRKDMASFLERAVAVRRNIVISGGTGSGKTTLLNVLSRAIPDHERVVTIEDAAELQLAQTHVVSLESRPPNLEGKGEYSIRDLVKNALRMRPDRIVVGECRGGEAIDMLQAMNTGHEGSMTTTHANSPREALARLETLCLMSGLDLPSRAIRQQIAASIHLIVQQSRFSDGSRRVTSIAEVLGIDDAGEVELAEVFRFERNGTGPDGEVFGQHMATGHIPSFIDLFISHGLAAGGEFL